MDNQYMHDLIEQLTDKMRSLDSYTDKKELDRLQSYIGDIECGIAGCGDAIKYLGTPLPNNDIPEGYEDLTSVEIKYTCSFCSEEFVEEIEGCEIDDDFREQVRDVLHNFGLKEVSSDKYMLTSLACPDCFDRVMDENEGEGEDEDE